MYERFTERARQVIVLAQDEARGMKHSYIGSEHLLLGVLREQEGLAARVLGELGVTVDDVRGYVAHVVGEGDEVTTGQIPFTPRAKKAQELALREALSLGHNYIGTEHILLGLARGDGGIAVTYLETMRGLNADIIRSRVTQSLLGRKGAEAPAVEQEFPAATSSMTERLAFAAACLRKASKILDEARETLDAH